MDFFFIICDNCQLVKHNSEFRYEGKYKCPNCNRIWAAGTLFFDIRITGLLKIIRHLHKIPPIDTKTKYCSYISKKCDMGIDKKITDEYLHQLPIIVFFCSLGEVLLLHFFEKLMFKKGIKSDEQDKYFSKHLSISKRVQDLFPKLVEVTWLEAMNEISKNSNYDHNKTSGFYLKVNKVRNLFLHEGIKWAIEDDMPEKCMEYRSPLLHLFVDLHNKYIADIK
ncbi:hypothetical protein C4588_05850 [Candidatus Parcubacteria bacterium]|nr:MAG: hypothetical protein C4588_05850 [Candidatus Parcubacteria bacterium]